MTERSDSNVTSESIAEHEFSEIHRLRRRIKLAQMLELYLYVIVLTIFFWREYIATRHSGNLDPIYLLYVITSPSILIAAGLVFIAIFFFILTGSTPLVTIALRGRLFRRAGWIGSVLDDHLIEVYENTSKRTHIGASASNGSIQIPNPLPQANMGNALDKIEVDFATYIQRSQEAARQAQRRPNALLFVGTAVALFGLIFFVLTLPSGRLGLLIAADSASATDSHDVWSNALQLVPRLLMLIFIQVLAGFFLRQYRSSMEEFRYYESVLRHREAQYLSYSLRKRANDSKAVMKFADELLKSQDFGRLLSGQTTAILEAQRAEQNEFGTLYQKMAALIDRTTKTPPKSRTSHKQE